MVLVLAPLCEIGSWRDAGEGPEVVDTMGLVKISAGQSNIRPIDLLSLSNTPQYLLKALDTTK